MSSTRGRWRRLEWSCALWVVALAAVLVVAFDEIIAASVRNGSDDALRLAVVKTYLGITGAYVLARSLGLAALIFSMATMALAFERARRRGKGLSVPRLLTVAHRQAGVVLVAIVLAHALVPLTGIDPPYGGVSTVLVPFGQPGFFGEGPTVYESLGIFALYFFAVAGPTYYLLARVGPGWRALHWLTCVAYVLAVVHVLFLGSDFVATGSARGALIAAQVPLGALSVAAAMARRSGSPMQRFALVAGGAVTIAAAVLAALVLSGALFTGVPL